MLHWREVLVVSADEEVRQNLAGILRQCGFEPVLTASVAEGRSVLASAPNLYCFLRRPSGRWQLSRSGRGSRAKRQRNTRHRCFSPR